MGVESQMLRSLQLQMEQEETAGLDRVLSVYSFRFPPGGVVEHLVQLSLV